MFVGGKREYSMGMEEKGKVHRVVAEKNLKATVGLNKGGLEG